MDFDEDFVGGVNGRLRNRLHREGVGSLAISREANRFHGVAVGVIRDARFAHIDIGFMSEGFM